MFDITDCALRSVPQPYTYAKKVHMQKCQLVMHSFSDEMHIEFHLSSPMLGYGNLLKPNLVSVIAELRIQLGNTDTGQIIIQPNIKLQRCSAARSCKKSPNREFRGDFLEEAWRSTSIIRTQQAKSDENVCQAENVDLQRTSWAGPWRECRGQSAPLEKHQVDTERGGKSFSDETRERIRILLKNPVLTEIDSDLRVFETLCRNRWMQVDHVWFWHHIT